MFSRQSLAATWKDVRPYFIFSMILFFAALVVGGSSDATMGLLLEQLSRMAELANEARNADNPQSAFFWIIVKNNMVAFLSMMYLGIGLGIVPLVSCLINGLMVGFVLHAAAEQGEQIWRIVLGLIPHGIVELPALFLASGFGMMLGVGLWKGIWGTLIGKDAPWSLFRRSIVGSIPILLILAIAVFVAALIESTVSYAIAS
jgi:stage II sporulation protein M